MALKLQLHKHDKVLVGNDLIMEVLSTGRTMQIAFSAPKSVKIVRIPADIDTYAKNAKAND